MALVNKIKNMMEGVYVKDMVKGIYASYLINEYELECKDGKYFKTYDMEDKHSKYKLDIIFFDKKDINSKNI